MGHLPVPALRTMGITMNQPKRLLPRRTAFSLVELLLALTIIAILSGGVCILLTGSLNVDRFLTSANATNYQVDLAVARMLHNLRGCNALSDPTATTTQHTFTVQTQPDPDNGLQSYTVVYALVGSQLIETDDRYGSNVICNNVTTFNVTLISPSTPISVQITLTAGTPEPVTRSFRALCRNL